MINQYGAQHFRVKNGRHVGTIPVGTIVYIQDGVRPFGWDRHHQIVCRDPWIVEAWIPRDYSKWDSATRQFTTVRIAGGHLAQVRSLRDNRRQQVADWVLRIDEGLERL